MIQAILKWDTQVIGVSINNDKYDYLIGEQAINQAKISKKHKLTYPMKDGIHYS